MALWFRWACHLKPDPQSRQSPVGLDAAGVDPEEQEQEAVEANLGQRPRSRRNRGMGPRVWTRPERSRSGRPAMEGASPEEGPCGEKLLSPRFQASASECKFMAGAGDNLDQGHL